MVLLTNRKKTIVGLEGYGLRVTGQSAIQSGRVLRLADKS